MSEVPCYPFAEALTVAGQFEIDLCLSALSGLLDRELVPVTDIQEVVDGLLDRRNVLDD
jgi:hypothetical protein